MDVNLNLTIFVNHCKKNGDFLGVFIKIKQ